ncbi:MAG: DnaJ domain-containing protein [Archangium sp.]|nr:DnaJ domain-containing protein [Archangium sp.]
MAARPSAGLPIVTPSGRGAVPPAQPPPPGPPRISITPQTVANAVVSPAARAAIAGPAIVPPVIAAPVIAPPVIAPPVMASPRASGVIAPPVMAPPRAPGVIAPPMMAPPRAPGAIAPPLTVPPGAPGAIVPPAPPARPPLAPFAPAAAAPAARPSPLPATGAVETITPQQAAALRKLAQGLNAIDYFQTLGLTQQATPGDIKKAFYKESRTYHPDRFFHLADSQEKTDIGSIYKRITEAYYVLRDDTKRKKYVSDLASADRGNKLRYTEATESELKAETRKTVEEEFGTHPKARPFFKTGLAEIEKGNLAAAVSALKMGLTYEPGNTRFKEKLVEIQNKIEDERRSKGPSYMIK